MTDNTKIIEIKLFWIKVWNHYLLTINRGFKPTENKKIPTTCTTIYIQTQKYTFALIE